MDDASWLPRLSEALSLSAEHEQDWGICNADAERASEFVQFYTTHQVVHPYEPEALAELILESFNDLLLEAGATKAHIQVLRSFLNQHSAEFPMTMQYWAELGDAEFPVSVFVRSAQ